MATASQASSKHKQTRCFVSAPFGCNVDVVIKSLTEAGVQAFRTDQIRAGETWIEAIRKSVTESDFACALLPKGYESSAMLFELGVAIGAGLPVLILVEDDARLPSDLAGLLYARVALDRPDTIRTAIHGFVRSIGRRSEPDVQIAQKAPKRISQSKALAALKTLNQVSGGAKGRRIEEFVASLFEQARIPVVVEPGPSDRGVDLAIWVDEMDQVLGNPILVEVKLRKLSSSSWSDAEAQLRKALISAGARCGILISGEPVPSDLPRVTPTIPTIMTFGIDELISVLAAGEFANELVRRRNLAVHGRTG